ncbi:uncharacterized protein [Rutidosis leptorrhynchoides]|uniref:uncharacterized protein n=1 Tax=Rutidosis leptorrhynchoides TaxID=125765 RepID=UPI003A9A5F95
MSWVKWDRVISSYEGGGLNIGSLKNKNLSLLGKWLWKFKTETNSFWVKIICSIDGPNGGLDLENDAIRSLKPSTWRNILLAGYEIEEKGVQFRNSLVKSVGNGRCTSFWEDDWLGGNKLRLLFPRLYRLEQNQDACVADRILLYTDTWNANWQRQRNPSGRTCGELSSLSNLLNFFNFNCGNIDPWIWSMSSNGKFTVKKLAPTLDEVVLSGNNNYEETMRNNLIPKKLEIFVWRITQKRLPVRIELDKRGIDLHTVRCPLCDDDLETVEHSLLFCNNAMEVWNRVYSWWGLGNMNNLSINEILQSKASSASMSCFGSKVWQAVEWVAAYFIWKNRNNMVFRGNKWNGAIALNEIQINSFEWISKRARGKNFEWLSWLNDPSVYLRS